MPSFSETLKAISIAIQKNKTFFVAGHVKPDGDTIGSALALGSLLERLGKKVELYSKEPVPDYLLFLPDVKKIKIKKKVTREFDCSIILECKDLERMGNLITKEQTKSIINIDHHSSFSNFGDINYVNPKASASAEQIFKLFRYLKMPLTPNEAMALYVGLVTDTGMFQQANTTPDSFRMAADLVHEGRLDPTFIYRNIYAVKTPSSLRLLGKALSTLKNSFSGRVAYMAITREAYDETGSAEIDTEGIINYTMMMPGVLIGVLFKETDQPGTLKVSFRSRDDLDINKIAKEFGGGGHKNAAGCNILGDLSQVEKTVLEHIQKILDPEISSDKKN
jgi:bifunctional oligoribonuclease and PAP phosphatase NrnA